MIVNRTIQDVIDAIENQLDHATKRFNREKPLYKQTKTDFKMEKERLHGEINAYRYSLEQAKALRTHLNREGK